LNISEHTKFVAEYALLKYREKFSPTSTNTNGGWRSYSGYVIISEKQIRIDYKYGGGDMEYSDSFIVDITPDIRDQKIEEIIENGKI
jgi:hypothetical protein